LAPKNQNQKQTQTTTTTTKNPPTLQEIEKKGTLPHLLYEVSITLILKLDKDTKRKESDRLVFLMNIGIKILNIIVKFKDHTP